MWQKLVFFIPYECLHHSQPFGAQNDHKALAKQRGVKIGSKATWWGQGSVWPGGSTEVVTRRHVGCACLAGRQSMQHSPATNTPTHTLFDTGYLGSSWKPILQHCTPRLMIWIFKLSQLMLAFEQSVRAIAGTASISWNFCSTYYTGWLCRPRSNFFSQVPRLPPLHF